MFAWSQFAGGADGPRVARGRRVELLVAVESRAPRTCASPVVEVREEGRVEALQPHVRVARVEPALVLQELRRGAVVDAVEGERGGAAAGDRAAACPTISVSGGLVSRPLKVWIGRRRVDVAGAVDRAHLEVVEALLEQLGLPAALAGHEQQLGLDRARTGATSSGASVEVVLDQPALVGQLDRRSRRRGRRVAGEVEGDGLQAVLDRAARYSVSGGIVVGRAARAVVLDGAGVAAAVLRAGDAALVGVRARARAPQSTARLSLRGRVGQRRAAVVGDRVQLAGWRCRGRDVAAGAGMQPGARCRGCRRAEVSIASQLPPCEAAADDRVAQRQRVRLRRDRSARSRTRRSRCRRRTGPSCARSSC